ncbi:MAG TPA: hypothetical protein VFU55_02430 [Terracidiphilus sp.]|nr:hypothetical protein [Terracidiphilus sp.]
MDALTLFALFEGTFFSADLSLLDAAVRAGASVGFGEGSRDAA